jgi:hypothetical protein
MQAVQLQDGTMTLRVKDLLAERSSNAFVGRAEELKTLTGMLGSGPRVMFVYGIAGIGKSTLLEVFTEKARASGASIVSLDSGAIEPTERGFLHELGGAIGEAAATTPEATAERLASIGTRVLLTLDNYEVFRLMDTWLRRVFIPLLSDHVRVIFVGRDRPIMAWLVAPGWQGLVATLELGPLDEPEAVDLLARCGAIGDGQGARRINRFARGHPLALKLAATVTMDRRSSDQAQTAPGFARVVEELTRLYLADVSDPLTRMALDAASVVRRTTLSLLQALLSEEMSERARDAFDRLRSLPFIEAERDGLRLHDLVHQTISSSLRATDPNRYHEYRRVAWAQLSTEARKTGQHDLWRYTADLLYLIENPVVREAFFPTAAQQYMVEPLSSEDGAAVQEIIRLHEEPSAADLMARWLKQMPEAFHVARTEDGAVVGFYFMFEFAHAGSGRPIDDPVVEQWRKHLGCHPVGSDERVLFLRRWLSRENGEKPSPVQAAFWLDIKRTYMEMRPNLRRVYLVLSDMAVYAPAAERLGFQALGGCDVRLGGVAYQSAVLDMGPQSVDGWLGRLAANELGVEQTEDFIDPEAHEVMLDGMRVKLTKLEFEVFVYLYRRKGRTVTRASLVENVWGWKQTGSNVVEAVVRSLRKKLGSRKSAIETIRGSGYRYRSA